MNYLDQTETQGHIPFLLKSHTKCKVKTRKIEISLNMIISPGSESKCLGIFVINNTSLIYTAL